MTPKLIPGNVISPLLVFLLLVLIAQSGYGLYRAITSPPSYRSCTEIVLSTSANPVVKVCR